MSEELKQCPVCDCPYGYPMNDDFYVCPECGNEWNPNEVKEEPGLQVNDAHGTPLANGDTVVLIKDLPVKGAPKPLRSGTKVKNIRLTDGDHNISCKIEGYGAMELKSEFVRKA